MTEETRAEIARRRLAQLAATFEAEFTGAPESPASRGPAHRSRAGLAPARLTTPHLRVIFVLATAAVVLLTWWLVAGRARESSAAVPLPLTPSASAGHSTSATASASSGSTSSGPTAGGSTSASAASDLVVDVVGKVRRPGIVTLPAGSRVHQAIKAAGGTTGKGVDTTNLNLARKLTDGEQIVVGQAALPSGAGSAPSASGSTGSTGALVNLNTADLAALDTLPGVGPVTAQAILDWRTENGSFTSVDDLLEVKGIGEATLADIRDRVTV